MNAHHTASSRPHPIRRILETLLVLLLASCNVLPVGQPGSGTPRPPAVSQQTVTPRPTQANLFASPTPSPTPPVALSELRGIKVVLWHPFGARMSDLLADLADEFNAGNEWGISASAVSMLSDSAMSEAMAAVDTADLPDAVLGLSPLLNGWYEAGRLAPLDAFIDEPQFGMSEAALTQFNADFWAQDQSAGAQVGIPMLRTAYGLIYNRTWAQELGFVTPPLTPVQFREQACEAARVNNRSPYLEKLGTGGWLVDTSSSTALSWLTAFGAQVTPFQEGDTYRFNQPDAEEAFAFLRGMQEAGCLWVSRNPSPYQYFADRYVLFYSGSLQSLSTQQILLTSLEVQDEWTFLPYPSTSGAPFALSDGHSLGIMKSSPSQEYAAWLFVRWLAEPENQARLLALYTSLPVSGNWQVQTDGMPAGLARQMVMALENVARPAPALSSWLVARRPLEDAFWQLFNLASAEQVPEVLPQLDAMLQELIPSK